MSRELEIEYKNLLNETEYKRLLAAFGFAKEDSTTQINHYFDTEDFRLKGQLCALRVRQKSNQFECTLKIPAEQGNYEITDALDEKQAAEILESRNFQAPEVLSALQEKEILPEQLQLIGSLTTHRIELDYEGGLLVFDHSEYCGIEDFEVEYEVQDAKAGKQIFTDFLKQHGIPKRHAEKKIARFMRAAESRS